MTFVAAYSLEHVFNNSGRVLRANSVEEDKFNIVKIKVNISFMLFFVIIFNMKMKKKNDQAFLL